MNRAGGEISSDRKERSHGRNFDMPSCAAADWYKIGHSQYYPVPANTTQYQLIARVSSKSGNANGTTCLVLGAPVCRQRIE